MRNPLRKRLLRELKEEAGKYAVIFLLMILSIGFISGFLVADNSMITAYNNSFETYNIEDGHFETQKEIMCFWGMLSKTFMDKLQKTKMLSQMSEVSMN